jgi:hypothetical protein
MTDYLFSNIPWLFDSISDETWFRTSRLVKRKSHDLHLAISVYRSGNYFIVIKCLDIGITKHLAASVLMKPSDSMLRGRVNFSEYKIYFETKTLEDTETLLLNRLLAIKLSSYSKTRWHNERGIIKYGDNTIMYSSNNSFIFASA